MKYKAETYVACILLFSGSAIACNFENVTGPRIKVMVCDSPRLTDSGGGTGGGRGFSRDEKNKLDRERKIKVDQVKIEKTCERMRLSEETRFLFDCTTHQYEYLRSIADRALYESARSGQPIELHIPADGQAVAVFAVSSEIVGTYNLENYINYLVDGTNPGIPTREGGTWIR